MADLGHRGSGATVSTEQFQADVEELLISVEIPQLILHVRLLHRALTEAGTRIYVKVGTTGTGGMGLNIPYTHGEDKPSPTLMAKTAIAFAHTGLLFLARTPERPHRQGDQAGRDDRLPQRGLREGAGTAVRRWRSAANGDDKVRLAAGPPYLLWEARGGATSATPSTTSPTSSASRPEGDDGQARARCTLPCVNTGENGIFTRGEFEAITALGQMEFVTPEEIARTSSWRSRATTPAATSSRGSTPRS